MKGGDKMRNKLKYAVFALLLTGSSAVYAAEDGWFTDFETAKKKAAELKKPLLVDFSGSDWCGWCIKLDKEVFDKEEFKSYAKDNLILVLADFPSGKEQTDELKKHNRELMAKYKVQGFPTVLLLDSEGKELARTGYKKGGAKEYVEHLKELLKDS
jgi:thioredoxin-related protein